MIVDNTEGGLTKKFSKQVLKETKNIQWLDDQAQQSNRKRPNPQLSTGRRRQQHGHQSLKNCCILLLLVMRCNDHAHQAIIIKDIKTLAKHREKSCRIC
jgi:hypothetical protein